MILYVFHAILYNFIWFYIPFKCFYMILYVFYMISYDSTTHLYSTASVFVINWFLVATTCAEAWPQPLVTHFRCISLKNLPVSTNYGWKKSLGARPEGLVETSLASCVYFDLVWGWVGWCWSAVGGGCGGQPADMITYDFCMILHGFVWF